MKIEINFFPKTNDSEIEIMEKLEKMTIWECFILGWKLVFKDKSFVKIILLILSIGLVLEGILDAIYILYKSL